MIENSSIEEEEEYVSSTNIAQINDIEQNSAISDNSANNQEDQITENASNAKSDSNIEAISNSNENTTTNSIDKEKFEKIANSLINGECTVESIDVQYYSNILEILCISKNEALFAYDFDLARKIQNLIDKITSIKISILNSLTSKGIKSSKFLGRANETNRAIKCFEQSKFDHYSYNDNPEQIYYELEASEAFWETEMRHYQESRENAYKKLLHRQNQEVDSLIHNNVSVKLQEPSAAQVLRASSQSLKTRKPLELGFKSSTPRLQSNLTSARSSRFQTIVKSQAPRNPELTERSLSLKLQILQQKPSIFTKRLVVSPMKKEIRNTDTGFKTTSNTVNQDDFSELFEYNRVLRIANDNIENRMKRLKDVHNNEITEFNREWDFKLRRMENQRAQEIGKIEKPMKRLHFSNTAPVQIPINNINNRTKKNRKTIVASK